MPNGRFAGTPMYDGGISAMPGADTHGPTALINSATKYPHAFETVGVAFNVKFSKAVLNTPEKLSKLASLVKTFNKRGGWHIQFNIHTAEELLEPRRKSLRRTRICSSAWAATAPTSSTCRPSCRMRSSSGPCTRSVDR